MSTSTSPVRDVDDAAADHLAFFDVPHACGNQYSIRLLGGPRRTSCCAAREALAPSASSVVHKSLLPPVVLPSIYSVLRESMLGIPLDGGPAPAAARSPRIISSRGRAIARHWRASGTVSRRSSSSRPEVQRRRRSARSPCAGRGSAAPRGSARPLPVTRHGHHRGAAQHRQHPAPGLASRSVPRRRASPRGTRAARCPPRARGAPS